jgi:ribosome-associated toxin RatA of RatAB toxin-antitoxin module
MVVAIRESLEVSATLDRVWDIVADVDDDPKYWPNLHTVDNISKDGDVIEREVTVGFRKSKSRQTILLNPKKSVEITMTEGPVKGTRVVTLILWMLITITTKQTSTFHGISIYQTFLFWAGVL